MPSRLQQPSPDDAPASEAPSTEHVDRRRLVSDLLASLAAFDEFAAAASHDLRSPLQAVQVRIHMIGSALAKLTLEPAVRDKLQRDLDSIRKNTHTQVELLNHLIDAARARGRNFALVLESFDAVALIRDVLDRFAPELARTGPPRLTLPDRAVLRADRVRVDEIASALVANAIDAAPDRAFELALAIDDHHLALRVRDDGPALSDESRQRCFERPRRADAPTDAEREPRLWIVKNLVVACGGSIAVDSAPPARGTTFTVKLPLDGPSVVRGG
jgi:signal transduction histidine kinase